MPKLQVVSFVAAFAAVSAFAQAPKPEKQIEHRKAAYDVLGYNFGSLAAMAQDKKPYNKVEATRNAELAAAIADYPRQFFTEGTDKGETKAKPEIWAKRADFDAKMDKMAAAVRTLPAAAGDLATLKKAVSDTGATCKACHDDFRNK